MARQAFKEQTDVSPTTGGIAGEVHRKPGRSDPVRRFVAGCANRNVPSTTKIALPGGLRLPFIVDSLLTEIEGSNPLLTLSQEDVDLYCWG